MPSYATLADLTAYVEGSVVDDAEAAGRLLERATWDIDDVLGALPPLPSGTYAGLKMDPTTLLSWEAKALADATCAQAYHRFLRGDELFRGGGLKRAKGPDYEVEYGEEATRGTGRYSPDVERILARITHLRPARARLR